MPKVQRRPTDNQQKIEERQKTPRGNVTPAEQPEQTPTFAECSEDGRSSEEEKAGDAEKQTDTIPDAGDKQGMAAAVERAENEQVDS